MRFRIHKLELSKAIDTAIKAVPPNSQIPILSGLLIETEADMVAVTGNGVSMAIKAYAAANVEVTGKTVVDAKMIDSIVKRLPDGKIVFECSDNSVTLGSGKSTFKISCMTADEFPAIEPPEKPLGFAVKAADLREIFAKTVPFAAVSEGKKPVIMGVLFEVSENTLDATATDGFKLAHISKGIGYTGEPMKLIIPADKVKALAKIPANGDVDIYSDRRTVYFDYGECQIYIRQIDGEFLKYRQLLNVEANIKATVIRAEIINAVERARLIANTEIHTMKPPVVFDVSGGKISVSCRAGAGKVADEVRADISGGDIRIGFNCRLLLDMLGACESDKVTLEMTGPRAAAHMRDGEAEFLVLPVRLYE